MQPHVLRRVVTLCRVSLAGYALAAMPSPATAGGAWVAPAWMAQGKYGGILKLVTNADPDHWDLHQSCCNPGPGAARDLLNALVMYNPVSSSPWAPIRWVGMS
ncbi:MAG: hypothetical protein HYZ81_04345 [Nitrospinae bacterium]|nr:hypothetical protein [Nitrospinota bacterium]